MSASTEVLECEVVSTTVRTRDRNTTRVLEILPPDVETKVVALRRLDGQSQATAVTAMLSHSRTGILTAIAAMDLPQIIEWKAKVSAVQEIAKQLQLGKDLQLDAAEFVRRAERGLACGIRDGQARGEIETPDEARVRAGKARHSAHGSQPSAEKPRPIDYAKSNDLYGSGAGPGFCALADGISEDEFEEALADARAEENLSRANVARKAKAKASPPPSIDVDDVEPPPKKVRKTAGARKVIEDLVVSINGLVFIVNDTNPAEVDAAKHKSDIEGIRQGMNTIRRFLNQVEQQEN